MQPQQRASTGGPRQLPPVVDALQFRIARVFGQDILPRIARSQAIDQNALIEKLARRAAAGDADGLQTALLQLEDQGWQADAICQVYLTGIARKLGEFWLEDRCTFVEVTLGVILLHDELRRLSPSLGRDAHPTAGRSALMVAAPGEQHVFGLTMLAAFFRAGGWDVEEVPSDEALERIAEAEFSLVGISVATSGSTTKLPRFIAQLRAASSQTRLAVMVGGAALQAEPTLLPLLGADATAPDAQTALRRAEALVRLMGATA